MAMQSPIDNKGQASKKKTTGNDVAEKYWN